METATGLEAVLGLRGHPRRMHPKIRRGTRKARAEGGSRPLGKKAGLWPLDVTLACEARELRGRQTAHPGTVFFVGRQRTVGHSEPTIDILSLMVRPEK